MDQECLIATGVPTDVHGNVQNWCALNPESLVWNAINQDS